MKTIKILLEDHQEIFDDETENELRASIQEVVSQFLEDFELVEVNISDDWGNSPYKKK
tara:strand:+ start:172 stop:345 length:174 start_codon:yes stop_codon:yes gene_type:complete